MANPFTGIKSGLIWDGDLNPEGLAVEWELGGDAAEFFINAGGFAVEERKADSDTWLFGALAGADLDLEVTSLELGLGYFLYDGMKGQTVLADPTDDFGNTSVEILDDEGEVESLAYVSDYAMVDAYVRAKFDVGMPLYAYGEFVNNTDAETSEDTGYIVGVTLGKAKAPGSWALDYNYRDLEADATVAAFADSDSGGGGTDHKGHRVKAKYQMAKNWQLALTYFNNTLDPDGSGRDYNRTQLDLVAKF